jgi:alanine racemase
MSAPARPAHIQPPAELAAWPAAIVGQPAKWAEIDTAALRDNAAAVIAHVGPKVAVMAIVKADAYGHGAVVASGAFLEGGATWLGVSSPEEALHLRSAGIGAPVLIVNWTHPASFPAMLAAGVDMAVFDAASITALAAAATSAGVVANVHLKVDTGMNRLGARPEELHDILGALRAGGRHLHVRGLYTHMADADGADLEFTHRQADRFDALLPMLREIAGDAVVHAANSAAMLRVPRLHHDLVRPGLALYGYSPQHCDGVVALRPAMTVSACVTQVKTVERGDVIGYGCTWTAPSRARVAVVAAGYADGIARSQSNRGAVLVGGTRCPIVGRVSMDQIGIDVSAAGEVSPGDEVIILGGRGAATIGADEVAATIGTDPREVLCAVSARVPRVISGRVRR